MTIEATVVVEFGDGADSSALVVVELDGEMNKDAEGEEITSFEPGMPAYFLVHYDTSKLYIGSVKSSAGGITGGTAVTRDREQQLSFTRADEGQDLPHIPAGGVTYKWYGNTPLLTIDGRNIKANLVPAICEAAYKIAATQYCLIPPAMTLVDDEQYPVLIVITMEAKTAMISVIVERPPADKQGPDISDPLITSEVVAVERGRNEIDFSYSDREIVSGELPYRDWIAPGSIVAIQDMEIPEWRAMATGCTISVTRSGNDFSAACNLSLERVA